MIRSSWNCVCGCGVCTGDWSCWWKYEGHTNPAEREHWRCVFHWNDIPRQKEKFLPRFVFEIYAWVLPNTTTQKELFQGVLYVTYEHIQTRLEARLDMKGRIRNSRNHIITDIIYVALPNAASIIYASGQTQRNERNLLWNKMFFVWELNCF